MALTWSSLFLAPLDQYNTTGVDPITATNSQGTVGTFNIGETNVTLTRSIHQEVTQLDPVHKEHITELTIINHPFNSSADQIVYNMWQASTNTGMSVHKFTFSNPVFTLAFKINDVDYESGAYKDNVATRLLKSDGTYSHSIFVRIQYHWSTRYYFK